MKRLLILSCSDRKAPCAQPLPALELYDGPAFRVLRKYLREGGGAGIRIFILSAKYGIISGNDIIAHYNQKMTPERASEIQNDCDSEIRLLLEADTFSEVFLCMSRTYLLAVNGIRRFGVPVREAAAGQGTKLASLKAWLREI